MPGMGTGLNENDPTIVSAFHNALLWQFLVVLLLVSLVGLAWLVLRWEQLRRAPTDRSAAEGRPHLVPYHEPAARHLLRISFGLLWIFDGLLQAQPSMPLGMAPQVIEPAAAASPGWVQHVDNAMATVWSYHPVAAPASAVWIQIGIGVWLLAAAQGDISRLAGLASVAWGLIVWIFGEAFGQVFAPGLSWLFGAPGAVLLYCCAGALIALPVSLWADPRLGRLIVRALGLFLVGMALLQAWPGRGFWQGKVGPNAAAGTLAGMVKQMAQSPQPHVLASWVAAFGSFDSAHGWAVNLFAVLALTSVGVAFLSGRPNVVKWAVLAGVVLCLADWVLVEDLGFMGGVGTDPNSMVPMALLLIGGYLALTRVQSAPRSEATTVVPAPATAGRSQTFWQPFADDPTYAFRSIAAIGAIGIALVGVVPMAVATTSPHADPILTQAIDGTPDVTDAPTPAFNLVNQRSQSVSLASLRGRAIALTFLDPVCTSDCPVIAQEFRAADSMLGQQGRRTELIAINANPRYTSPSYLQAFDQQEGLEAVPNWLYLTGSLPQLEHVWDAFGIEVAYEPGGAMIGHSEVAYVIDPTGHTRFVLDADPGPGTEATRSSFAVTLASALEKALRPD